MRNRGSQKLTSAQSVPLSLHLLHATPFEGYAVEESRLLVIDNHDLSRQTLVEHLRKRGWVVMSAPDFKTALTLAERHQPHAIVSEMVLRDVRGHHFVRALKTVVDHDVRIVGLSDLPMELVDRTWPSSFDMLFVKPVDLDVVADFLERALRP